MTPILRAACWTAAVLACGHAEAAEPAIEARAGDHPGFGRLVFEVPAGCTGSARDTGGSVELRFTGPCAVAVLPRAPRNVATLAARNGGVDIVPRPGVKLRTWQLGSRLVYDFLDVPAALKPAAAPVQRPTATPTPSRTVTATVRSMDERIDRQSMRPGESEPTGTGASAVPTEPASAKSREVAAAGGPASMRIAAAPVPAGEREEVSAFLLPFAAEIGAAAFRNGDDVVVVFDERRPIDLAALREMPRVTGHAIRLLPAATILTLQVKPQHSAALSRGPEGWLITVEAGPPAPATKPIQAEAAENSVRFRTEMPGRVVTMVDPETGAVLLVGTVRATGPVVLVGRQTPDFGVLKTVLGVVVRVISEQVVMRAVSDGFVLATSGGDRMALSSPLGVPPVDRATGITRKFDFPTLPTAALLRRLQAAQSAAAALPQERTVQRAAVAQAMIALGLGAEAQSILSLAGSDDGRVGDMPEFDGLRGIAALLAGRPAEAEPLNDPRLDGTDEIEVWRALLRAAKGESEATVAPVLAANLPLLLSYPPTLIAKLLPQAAEAMIAGGQPEAARKLVETFPNDPALDLARAALVMASNEGGGLAKALEIFDRVINRPDRRARAKAMVRSVELRLAAKEITPAEAADRLERGLFAWRGDDIEYESRRRIAALRQEAGKGRQALALLRETAQFWPDKAAPLREQMITALAGAVAETGGGARGSYDLITLVEANTDLLPGSAAGQELAGKIAENLMRLELPARAAPILEKIMNAAAPGGGRGEAGTRLATALLGAGDFAGVLRALEASPVAEPTVEQREMRALLFARAAAGLGDLDSARNVLTATGGEAAQMVHAELMEAAGDWKAATGLLDEIVTRAVPITGVFTRDQAVLVLRLASAAARAGDAARNAALRSWAQARFPAGEMAGTFDLLTASPLGGVADLPRAAKEAKLARAVPGALAAMSR